MSVLTDKRNSKRVTRPAMLGIPFILVWVHLLTYQAEGAW